MNTRPEMLSNILGRIASEIDIPDHLCEKATAEYKRVGSFLQKNDLEEGRREPEIYSQGSFRLGTVVKPLGRDDYDIDLVYVRDLAKSSITQSQLKEVAGRSLKEYVKHLKAEDGQAPELKANRRSWTLDYDEPFHLDILPAIPDLDGHESSILLTDSELREWQHSNPKEYANWFQKRMINQFLAQQRKIAAATNASVDDVPKWKVRTPLQRVVQILKRHRDLYFINNPSVKPVSITLTTLAALSYESEPEIYTALLNVVDAMPSHIQKRDGRYLVLNPVQPKENFADKWNEYPDRKEAFFGWLRKAKEDFATTLSLTGIHKISAKLRPVLGEEIVERAIEKQAKSYEAQRKAGRLSITTSSGAIGTSGNVPLKDHTFYGSPAEE